MTSDNQLPTDATEGTRSGVWDFDKEYEARRASYDRALIDLRERLGRLIEDLERDGLFRARIVSGRVKEADRIKRKAERDGIPLDNALDVLRDIVGVRVVCNNLEDVDKVIENISKHPEIEVLDIDTPECLHIGTDRGYRARHMVVDTIVYVGHERQKVLAEVQIRTLLQDAWAHLSHDDFYKPKEQTLRWLDEQMKELSDRLYALDRQAQDIRGAIEKRYIDLKRSLRTAVATRVTSNDLSGAMRALSESLYDQDPALQLTAVDVFIENPVLWQQGMHDFATAVSNMAEWMKIRVADRLSNVATEQVDCFEPVIEAL